MPFRSSSQRRLFYLKANRGEIPKSTVEEWEAATPKGKKLPEHVKKQTKKASFFDKISQKLPKNHNNVYYTTGVRQVLSQFGLIQS